MPDSNATAAPTTDSREDVEEKDSVNQQTPSEDTEPQVGTQEAPEGEEEETSPKNETDSKDPEGTPEDDDEETDPLKKAKKHADRKISEMGEKISTQRKALESAVKRSPQLLIDLYDPNSELYDKELADRIAQESPETYAEANRLYKQKQQSQGVYTAPAATSTSTQGLTQDQVQQMIAQQMKTIQVQQKESGAVAQLRESLGYTEEQFSVVKPALKQIADSIRKADPEATWDAAYRRAFLAMFPGDYDKQVAKDAYIKASAKVSATSVRGGQSPSTEKKTRLSDVDMEAAKVAGLTPERYAELREKGLI